MVNLVIPLQKTAKLRHVLMIYIWEKLETGSSKLSENFLGDFVFSNRNREVSL